MLLFTRLSVAFLSLTGIAAYSQESQVVLDRPGETIALEPYAPNIIRVSLSLDKGQAIARPGYGLIANPSPAGWTHEQGEEGDVYRSSRLIVTVGSNRPRTGNPLPTHQDIAKYFNGSAPPAHITVKTPEGKTLAEMTGWAMSVPNNKDGNAGIVRDKRPSDIDFFQVGATFVSPPGEHYYGLGQNQEGRLDLRGHAIQAWHNYTAAGGPSIGVPFIVTSSGYGLIWDNPSRTTLEPGLNEQTRWISEVGNRVSFFVIAGENTDEIYSGYRLLTGTTPLLPKAAYGFIQCKQRYATQEEVMSVARGYRERHLPLDVLVVDWFYFSKMGQMDMVPDKWPDPRGMNQKLKEMGNSDDDQRLAAVYRRDTLLRSSSQERLVRTSGRRNTYQRTAV